MSLSPAMQKFVELEKKKTEIKKYFEDLQTAIAEVAAEIGEGGMFQDDAGTVYKVTRPEGKFVTFDRWGYDRTKREGEARGTLSVKEATERGFAVK